MPMISTILRLRVFFFIVCSFPPPATLHSPPLPWRNGIFVRPQAPLCGPGPTLKRFQGPVVQRMLAIPPSQPGVDKIFIQTQTIRENDLTHDAAISVRGFHLDRDFPSKCHISGDLLSSPTEGLPSLRAVYSVKADFNGPALTHDRDGVAFRYPYYFSCECGGLRISEF